MSLRLYMDHHVSGPATRELRHRGVWCATAEEDGNKSLGDPALLDRAGALGCVLVSQDLDLLAEAARRQRLRIPFSGLFYSHQLGITVGQLDEDLELAAKVYEPPDMADLVVYLPF